MSVAVSCNFDPVSATALAGRVADLFLPAMKPQAVASGPVAAAGVDVSGRAGLFFNERTGEPMRLGVGGGQLRIANGPALIAVAQDRFRPARSDLFFRSQDEFELRFVSADKLEVKSMEGAITRYRLANAWTPTAADLQAADGRYESAELGSVFEIVPGRNALVMRLESSPEKALELTAVERDIYVRSLMIVRFRRDASGTVVGFDYGNPLVRDISFTRRGERTRGVSAPAVTVPKDAAPATPSSSVPRLDGLAGEYELAPGRLLAITLTDGQLHGQPPGSEKRLLVHVSGTTFSATGSAVTLTFTLGAEGRATAVVMRQNGNERTVARVR